MTPTPHLPAEDLERLSAYIDGELSPEETSGLEARLAREPGLRTALNELRSVVRAARSLPAVRVPRSFTLTPEMAGLRTRPRFPVLQLASAISALAFVLLFSVDLLGFSMGARQAAAPAPEVLMFEAPAAEAPELAVAPPETATGEPPLGEAEAPAAAALEAQSGLADEGVAQDQALKSEPTPLPMIAGESLAAGAAENAQPEVTAMASGERAAVQSTEEIEAPPESPVPETARGTSLEPLRLAEITLASLSLLFALLSLLLRRRWA